jgi:ABC-type transport system involved in multi-copper enzyme maturation permease subunit
MSSTRQSRSPGIAYAAFRVFDLSLPGMLWSKRTVFMALVVGLPVVLSLVLRALAELGGPVPRFRGDATGPTVFGLMIWAFFVRFSVPVLAVFYGTSLIADEVEDKTITYLFVRPISRESVLLGKYLAYLVSTVFVVLPAVVLVWLLIVPIGGTLGGTVFDLSKDLAVIAAGLAVYGAVFALVGATVRRPLVVGLVFVFGWEVVALAMPGSFRMMTVAYYIQGLIPHAMPTGSALDIISRVFTETPTLGTSVVGMSVIAVGALVLAARAVARREYVLDQ